MTGRINMQRTGRDPAWIGSGTRAVVRILIRRRLKCQRAGQHTPGYCKACGIRT